jgi:SSS family solute:Na+ symporter
MGLFWPRANSRGAGFAIASGLVVGTALFVLNLVTKTIDLHFLYVAPILLAVAALGMVVGSLTSPPPEPDRIAGLLWNRAYFDVETAALRGTPWFRNYRVLSVLLLIATAVIVIAFW